MQKDWRGAGKACKAKGGRLAEIENEEEYEEVMAVSAGGMHWIGMYGKLDEDTDSFDWYWRGNHDMVMNPELIPWAYGSPAPVMSEELGLYQPCVQTFAGMGLQN